VEIQLGRNKVNPDKQDKISQMRLSYAASGGYPRVVRIVHKQEDVSADKADKDCRRPLMCADSSGHGGVVEILLGREEVNPK